MRAVIIEDEPLARRELRRLLAPHPTVEIIGEAANVEDAKKLIESTSPDLLFLDIHMPGGTGFDLLEQLEQVPAVIFTTAYDEHAVRAFEVDAIDYLLKPIEADRLAAAIGRMEAAAAKKASATTSPQDILEQIFVRDGERCWFVPLHEVHLIASEGNYVRLHWKDVKPLLGKSLVNLELRLDPKRFFRANRQQVINIDFVDGVEMGVGGRLHIQLKGGPEIEVSRRQARLFIERAGG
ncbi:MAG TPA: LytTR family DNA-binding domain-containing protein [Steroidobacteraceae bacterium]|nr:LytTR family DNA-binding domain-containing protein [Steroidobacteraceae bacterium]